MTRYSCNSIKYLALISIIPRKGLVLNAICTFLRGHENILWYALYVASTIVMDIHFDEFLVNCQAVFCHFVKNFGKYARKISNIFQSGHSIRD